MSQHEANKMIRVLLGEKRKYTIRIHKPDLTVIEFQSETVPKLEWQSEARCLMITDGPYPGSPIMKWEEGVMMFVEENK